LSRTPVITLATSGRPRDHQLGVHVEAAALGEARHVRVVDVEAAVAVGGEQALHQARAQHLHGVLLEPAVAQQAQDQHHFRPVALGEALLHRRGDALRGEVLVLDVQRALRVRDGVEVQLLDLADRRRLSLRRHGARDADVDVAQVGLQLLGPGVVADAGRLEALAGRRQPAVARDAGELARGIAVDCQHQVVERRVGFLVRGAPRVVGLVVGAVEAPHGEVDAADESDAVVHHGDLLVLAAGDRMGVVVAQVHAPVRRPAEPVQRREFAVGAEDHRVIPVQHVDVQAAAAPDEVVEEIAEQRRRAVLRHRVEVQARAAVEVPRQHVDRALRAQRGVVERAEIRLRVDQYRDALRACYRTAVVAGAEEGFRRRAAAGARLFLEVQDAAHASLLQQTAFLLYLRSRLADDPGEQRRFGADLGLERLGRSRRRRVHAADRDLFLHFRLRQAAQRSLV
jgi:hypothetical protein